MTDKDEIQKALEVPDIKKWLENRERYLKNKCEVSRFPNSIKEREIKSFLVKKIYDKISINELLKLYEKYGKDS